MYSRGVGKCGRNDNLKHIITGDGRLAAILQVQWGADAFSCSTGGDRRVTVYM